MEEDCPVCRQKYDTNTRIPMLICISQHLCCLSCYQAYYKEGNNKKNCIICKVQIDTSKVAKSIHFIYLKEKLEKYKQKLCAQAEEKRNKLIQKKTSELQQIIYICFASSMTREKYIALKHKSKQLITRKKYKLATSLLKLLIENSQDIMQFINEEIIGIGSRQEEIGFSQNCDIDWYCNYYQRSDLSSFDMLNFLSLRNHSNEYEWYLKMINQHPSDYRYIYSLGLSYHNKRKFSLAKDCLQNTITLRPDFPKSYQLLSFIQQLYKDPIKAKHYAQKCLERDSDNIYSQFVIAQLSANPIQKLIILNKKNPAYVRVSYQICVLLFKQKRYEEVISKCNECHQLNSLFLSPLYLLATTHAFSRSFRSYKIVLQKLLQVQKGKYDLIWIYDNLGKAHFCLKQYKDAITWLKKCASFENLSQRSKSFLAKSYFQQKMYKESLEMYIEIEAQAELKEKNIFIISIINILNSYGKQTTAEQIVWLKKLEQLNSQQPEIFYFLSDKYQKNEKWAESLLWSEKCIQSNFKLKESYQIKCNVLSKLKRYEQAFKTIADKIQKCELNACQYEAMFMRAGTIAGNFKKECAVMKSQENR